MNYEKQAQDFLKETNTTLEVVEAVPQTPPNWSATKKHGIKYSVTLKNDYHTYVFDFWSTIRDSEMIELAKESESRGFDNPYIYELKKQIEKRELKLNPLQYRYRSKGLVDELKKELLPNAYDILACLSPMYEHNFQDFCNEFGFNEDSIQALKTYEACQDQELNLRRLFDHSQLGKLGEIQ